MTEKSNAGPLDALHAVLLHKINGWKAAREEDRSFDPVTIFDYIDGAGEVYRAYNMQKCISRRYTAQNGPSTVMDILDMGSSEDAFGVFTHYLSDADSTGVARLEDGRWSVAMVKGTLLATVLESDTRQFAESLLKRVMAISPASQLRLTTKGADDTEEIGWSLTIEEERKRLLPFGLGNSRPDRIQLIKLGWKTDILI